jgi:transmembrane sensor
MKNSEQIWIRLARCLAGEMDMKEEIAFRHKMESNPKLKSELEYMEKNWKYINAQHPHGEGDPEKAWEKLYDRLEKDGLLDPPMAVPVKRSLNPALRIAATILLVLAIGIPSLYLGFFRNAPDRSTLHQYADKGVSTVDLPDGSRVFLNEGAEITYPATFNKERRVNLRGEAFFEVMSDPINPFTVSSGRVLVSVLGTSFNIKELPVREDVEVYVETGKVRLTMEETGEFITLEPGDVGHASNNRLSNSELTEPNYLSWKTKDFKFVDEALDQVLRELGESYHVSIHAEELDLAEMRITSTYKEQSIDAILETIGTAFGLTVSKKEGQYYLEH